MYKKKKGTDSSEGLMPVASPSTPVAPSDNLSSSSEGKVNTLSADKQLDGVEIEFYRSAFKNIYKEGGLFGQGMPLLDEIVDKSVLAYSEEAAQSVVAHGFMEQGLLRIVGAVMVGEDDGDLPGARIEEALGACALAAQGGAVLKDLHIVEPQLGGY